MDVPTKGLRILASSFAVLYEAVPMLDIMGLNGVPAL